MSGPRVERFREGWGLLGWGKVHYFRRAELGRVKSLCGVTSMAGWIFEPGTFPLCKRCEAKANAPMSGEGE